jgi:hypothetical protein
VPSDYLYLPECRSIKDANCRAHGSALAVYCGAHILAGLREIARALPLTYIFEYGAPRDRFMWVLCALIKQIA